MKKFYISVDMEGITGTVSWQEYERDFFRFRKIITEEVNALLRGIENGLNSKDYEVLICDAHGSGLNILFEELPENVLLVRGGIGDLGMMAGIDNTFSAAFFLGYHSEVGEEKSLMDHTYASLTIYEIKINGKKVNEAMINAAIAGYFNVPLVFVSGDDKLIKNVEENFPRGIETVITKYGISRFSAITKTLKRTLKEIEEKASSAVKKIKEIEVYKIKEPIYLEISLNETIQADIISFLPNVKRISGRIITAEMKDIIETQKLIRLIALLGRAAKEFFR
ncbi:MAG: M55 family metallopeptidase [candidate division WOR-3 bacterium]|nr:M55 family metallopeptidase [candidate division WOR-3 bacterium]MCX7837048.1 M55 family metallopeptidase [candidate division WOR-3 bacterium]MDW8113782.1 M55 family metallopeptidase [candidate division WOR-3 bacterium]